MLIAVAGVLLVARGMYRLMRTLVDLLSPRTLVGEVLWVAPWRSRRRDGDPEVIVHYLAVDDGTSDGTTAWALPSTVTRGFGPGDTVEITVRPWSRRVTALRVAQSRHLHPAHRPAVPGLAASVTGPAAGSAPVPLLPPEELGARLGIAVTAPRPAAGGVPGAWSYPLAAVPDAVVQVSVGSGRADHLVLGLHRGGEPLPGLGDEAYLTGHVTGHVTGHGAVARAGDVVVRVAVPVAGDVRREGLIGVLSLLLPPAGTACRPDPADDRPGELPHAGRPR